MCLCALPGKAIPEMTYTVSDRTLNPPQSLTLITYFCHICAVFKDVNTQSPFVEEFPAFEPSVEGVEYASAALPDHIYMDAMAFGMGCCCLQMTFQACNICEARLLYDQLTPMCPIMVHRMAS